MNGDTHLVEASTIAGSSVAVEGDRAGEAEVVVKQKKDRKSSFYSSILCVKPASIEQSSSGCCNNSNSNTSSKNSKSSNINTGTNSRSSSNRSNSCNSSFGIISADANNNELSAKDLARQRNKEHARITRQKRKQTLDAMKANLVQLQAENERLIRSYEDKKTALMILGLNVPSLGDADAIACKSASGASPGPSVDNELKSSESLVKEVLDLTKKASAEKIEENAKKLKEIGLNKQRKNKMLMDNKKKGSELDEFSSAKTDVQSGDESESSSSSNSNSNAAISAAGTTSEKDSDESASIRKMRNRIHSMNTRERRKRFHSQLEVTVENLRLKNRRLASQIEEVAISFEH
jgi:hypothetical protein